MIDDGLLEMARETAAEARDAWLKTNGSNIDQQVKKLLDKGRDDIILQILGFNASHLNGARWEIDHCNGRNGNSFIGEQIAGPAKQVCAEVISRILEDWKPSEELIAELRQAFEKELRQSLRYDVREAAQREASIIASKIAKEMVNGGA